MFCSVCLKVCACTYISDSASSFQCLPHSVPVFEADISQTPLLPPNKPRPLFKRCKSALIILQRLWKNLEIHSSTIFICFLKLLSNSVKFYFPWLHPVSKNIKSWRKIILPTTTRWSFLQLWQEKGCMKKRRGISRDTQEDEGIFRIWSTPRHSHVCFWFVRWVQEISVTKSRSIERQPHGFLLRTFPNLCLLPFQRQWWELLFWPQSSLRCRSQCWVRSPIQSYEIYGCHLSPVQLLHKIWNIIEHICNHLSDVLVRWTK